MAEKGDKARLYDIALRMYAEGKSLTEIETALGVSRQTLAVWKADSKRPNDEADTWDRARSQKRNDVQRLRDLWDRELTALENTPPGKLDTGAIDRISKLGALVMKWEHREKDIRAQEREKMKAEAMSAIDKADSDGGPMTVERFKQIILETYGVKA